MQRILVRNVVRTGWGQNDWIYIGVSSVTGGVGGGNLRLAFNASTSLYDSGTFDFRVVTYGTVTGAASEPLQTSHGERTDSLTFTDANIFVALSDVDAPETTDGTWAAIKFGGWSSEWHWFEIAELAGKSAVGD